ncbi:hypothetical protein B0H14DRAFT_3430024 [Mycena olivaceomarginata]|nr:hypothetical protein B0H14DRAFT_3430024 [Mycena olivaceomarginata]
MSEETTINIDAAFVRALEEELAGAKQELNAANERFAEQCDEEEEIKQHAPLPRSSSWIAHPAFCTSFLPCSPSHPRRLPLITQATGRPSRRTGGPPAPALPRRTTAPVRPHLQLPTHRLDALTHFALTQRPAYAHLGVARPPPRPAPYCVANPLQLGRGHGWTWARSWGLPLGRSALAAGVFAGTAVGSPSSLPSVAGVAGAGVEGRGREVLAPVRAAVGGLAFAADETRLLVVRQDVLGAGVWGLRPRPSPPHHAGDEAGLPGLPVPTHIYVLSRGRTGAVVEAVAGARDGQFVAFAMRRRTVHLFAVNPYGKHADVRSHLRARVTDAEGGGVGVGMGAVAAGQGPTEVERTAKPPAIAFVPAVDYACPPAVLHPGASGVQDVFVFDPADSVLSLRRVTLALEAQHAAGLPISMSLPARAGYAATSYKRCAGAVATWSLKRKRGWAEMEGGKMAKAEGRTIKEDWLAQAELSIFTGAPRVLPRAIYLSHQFSFYSLGQDSASVYVAGGRDLPRRWNGGAWSGNVWSKVERDDGPQTATYLSRLFPSPTIRRAATPAENVPFLLPQRRRTTDALYRPPLRVTTENSQNT